MVRPVEHPCSVLGLGTSQVVDHLTAAAWALVALLKLFLYDVNYGLID